MRGKHACMSIKGMITPENLTGSRFLRDNTAALLGWERIRRVGKGRQAAHAVSAKHLLPHNTPGPLFTQVFSAWARFSLPNLQIKITASARVAQSFPSRFRIHCHDHTIPAARYRRSAGLPVV